MAQTNLGRLLRAKVEDRINELAHSLANGAAADYPNYRQTVGLVQGLNESIQILDELERERD
jgi:hypothetical protein